MGSGGPKSTITEGLEAVWGYEPSVANMRVVLDYLAYDRSRVTDDLAKLRYEASVRPGHQESFAAMVPSPRQARLDELSIPDHELQSIPHETLLVHGREDQVIPVETSIRLNRLLKSSQLHVFGKCGHWVQIEQTRGFISQVENFLSAE
jgi:pimeloyl-ACP methyl ester carboxylesterase